MVDSPIYDGAIRSLWLDTCDIYVKQEVENAVGRTVQQDTLLYQNVPCRLSFKTVTVTNDTSHAAQQVQQTVLFVDKTLEIPAGSKIVVTHEGVTRTYKRSGVPSGYSVHQQVPVELQEDWA